MPPHAEPLTGLPMATERPMVGGSERNHNLVLALPVAAFSTSLFLLCLISTLPRLLFLLGPAVGIVVGRVIAKANVVCGSWGWLVVAWIAAQLLSMVVVGLVQLLSSVPTGYDSWSNPAPFSPIALGAGGLIGGLLIIGTLSLLRRIRISTVVAQALLGMASGAILAVIGWRLAPSLGTSFWECLRAINLTRQMADSIYGPRAPANLVCSLYLVWPTGIAFVMALTLPGTRAPN
jgi:hypothetical protein